MRLIDLNPTWFIGRWVDANGSEQFAEGRHGMGVIFDCPIHGDPCRLAVPFENPVDGLPRMCEGMGKDDKSFWRREGDTFETLTLSPSIDASYSGHWHGFIISGQVKS